MHLKTKPSNPLFIQCSFVLLFILWQIGLFSIYYHINDLIDPDTYHSIFYQITHFNILLPIAGHILIQLASYVLIIAYIYFISTRIKQYFQLSDQTHYWFSLSCLLLALLDLIAFNTYYFPLSFFAGLPTSKLFLMVSGLFWTIVTLIAYIHFFYHRSNSVLGWLFLSLAFINVIGVLPRQTPHITKLAQPNIILIGLDSLRPDFISFYNPHNPRTANIDHFLKGSTVFDHAYTPLARTFPSWMSILTAQYPKHNGIRNNLADRKPTHTLSLAKQLQQAGYYTIYASDEKRFSNILPHDGFDRIAGPSMGVNDFILGSLSDFPLANLLTKLPIAKYLLPYSHANRAAAITYQPKQFLSLITDLLSHRPDKPLFLAIHLCLTHWPYTWADSKTGNELLPVQYQHSVAAIDKQFGELLAALQQNNLLNNSIVVLLSDHGTALGLPNDTVLDKKNYRGAPLLLKKVPASRFSNTSLDTADFKHDYSINTSYGQGTNVASIKQYHTLLAFRRFGEEPFQTAHVSTPVSLIDIAPTLLATLKLPPLANSDGISLINSLLGKPVQKVDRAFFLETGDSLSEIETDHVNLEKVVAKKIGIYRINPITGLLTIDPIAEHLIIKNKQRAIIWGDWLLAHYPATIRNKLVSLGAEKSQATIQSYQEPEYDVLVNLNTKQWTIGLNSSFAKQAPVATLKMKLEDFYGDEIVFNNNVK